MPHSDAGWRIDPPVSVPNAAAHNPAVQRFLDPDILINALGGQGQTP